MNNPVLFIDTTGNCPENGEAGFSDELWDGEEGGGSAAGHGQGKQAYCQEAIVFEVPRLDQHEENEQFIPYYFENGEIR